MTVILNKGKDDEVRYHEEDIKKMNRTEIKQLKAQLQVNLEEVAMRKTRYQCNNNEAKNSDEYWRRMTSYKQSMNIIRREIVYLSGIEKLAEVKPEPEQEREQHWLWCFYQETIDKVNKRTLAKLTEMADARAGYHFDLDAVPKKEA